MLFDDEDTGRERVHSERLWSYSNDAIKEAVGRGRGWVQRNYREWPFGHALRYQIRTRNTEDWVDFYFVPELGDDDRLL